MEPLASSNPRIKRLRRLSGRRSARSEEGRFVLEGPTLVAEAVRSGRDLEEVFVEAAALAHLPADVLERGVTVVRDGVLGAALSTGTPQPVCAVAPTDLEQRLGALVAATRTAGRPLVVLADVADPGNAGTVLRSAEAAGAAGVVFAGRAVEPYNPKVVRSSAGSLLRVPFAVERSVDAVLAALGDVPSLAATAAGPVGHLDAPLGGAVAILVGNEAHGLDADIVARCTAAVRIDMDGPTESLNVAMAATVLLFEALRQRGPGKSGGGLGAVDHNGGHD